MIKFKYLNSNHSFCLQLFCEDSIEILFFFHAHRIDPVENCVGAHPNKGVEVKICESPYNDLAVHSIGHSAVAWNQISEILY